LGLIISKRCAKSAVRRNRLKRLIRESFRLDQQALAGLDVVVIGKSPAVEKTNQELSALLSRQWKELQRCKES
jgi:ribonuclease P protein component